MTYKQRLFLNMLVAQAGFAILSVLAIIKTSNILAIILVNVVFGVIMAYLQWASYNRIKDGVEKFKIYLRNLIDFTFMRKNRLEHLNYDRSNEIGGVLKELDKFADEFEKTRHEDMKVLGEMVLILNKLEQGIFSCKVKSTSSNFMIKELIKVTNNMIEKLSKNMNELKDTLSSYTNNDYTPVINIDKIIKDEMKEVLESVNILGETLRNTAKANLQNGQILDENARSMSDSMQNLAHKANQQAASLEETAAAVEEITSITRNNANNAVTMANLGNEVKVAVEDGNKLAHQTVSAMENINDRVTAINEAISVIDQIAFQTNILSLNAAVEAATAGEAGKGFAVVAGEVRNLAARSAEAANEIKKLVEEATLKANEGKEISEDMIAGYERLNEQITQTIDIIEQVSSASKEQMQGIEQINDAVNTLDRVTQENASEANHVAQIANSLRNLANQLLEDAKSKKF